MITKAPFMTPAPPHPATALPSINITEEVDAAQRSDPNWNIPTAPRNMN